MNILVFGAGVIGSSFAWQLQETGNNVTLFVKKQRMVRLEHSGIPITYTDTREGKNNYGQTVFRPKVIDRLEPSRPFDLIIVAVRSNQLSEAIPHIAKFSGNAHILFLGNLWNEINMINKHFPKSRCFFGFPGMVTGGHHESGINCYLFRKGHTMLGEINGKVTERLKETAGIMEKAGLRPCITKHIKDWLPARYVISAIQPGLISKAGSARLLVSNRILMKQYISALKEGQKVCRKKKIKAVRLFPFHWFFLPHILLQTFIRRQFTPEVVAAMDAHMKHGSEEKKRQFYNVLNDGRALKVPMPYWRSFEKYLDFD